MPFRRRAAARSALFCALFAALLQLGLRPPIAAGGWPDERRAGPFLFHADFSLANHAHLLGELAQLQRDLAQTLSIGRCPEPIHLFLFARQSTYQSYLRHYFPGVPYRRALFIKRRGPGMVFAYVSRDFQVDVRHECTHALLHACFAHLPLWLDEGLAEYFEVPPADRAFNHPHLRTLRRALILGGVPSIQALEQIRDLDQMGPRQYRRAWSWVHFMLHGPPAAHDEFVRYLADLQAGRPAGRLSERLRRRLPELEHLFLQHFRNWRR